MSIEEEIKGILADTSKTKKEKDALLSELGLRPADIVNVWFKYRMEHPKAKKPLSPKKDEDVLTEFRKRYPDAPEPKRKDVLNLILRKEIAQEIISGEKKVEIREVSPFYTSRLLDKDVAAYIEQHPEISHEYGIIYDPLIAVDKIHFYSYSNTWHLDVECLYNAIMTVCNDDVKFLQEEYNCHEFDEMLDELKGSPEGDRPQFYIFIIGRILDKKL